MIRPVRAIALLALFAAAGDGSTAAAVPSHSTFELRARSNIVDGYRLPPNSSFNSKTPVLNDAGTIGFSLIAVGGGNAGLFTGGAGDGAVVYTAPDERLLEDPSINAEGELAFDQFDVLSDGIYVHDPASGKTVQAIPAVTFSIATSADIFDDGRIAYRASAGGPQSWRVFSDGAEAVWAFEGGPIAFLFTPSSRAGLVAGKVRLGSTAGSSPDELRLYDGPGSFAVIAADDDGDPRSLYVGFDNGVWLAPDGRVAFVADLAGGGRGVFLSDGATTTTIATTAHPGVSAISFFRPAANAAGLVAFRGTDAAGLDAIFAGDGTALSRVVGEHDLVPTDLGAARIDQHDDSVVFGGGLGINGRGDIAFNASLTPPDNPMIEWGSGMFVALADGPAAPPPVPDGDTVPGMPLRAGKASGGAQLTVEWDVATCTGEQYDLLLGDLDTVGDPAIGDAACDLGTSGSAVVPMPPGDVFFVIVSETSAGVESGHGVDSTGTPRPSSGVGFCGIVEQSLEGSCPSAKSGQVSHFNIGAPRCCNAM